MSLDETNLSTLFLSVKLEDINDKIERLESVADRLENVFEAFASLFKEARIQGLEAVLHEMLKKGRQGGNRTG